MCIHVKNHSGSNPALSQLPQHYGSLFSFVAGNSHFGARPLPPCAAGARVWLERLAFSAKLVHPRRKVAGVQSQNANCCFITGMAHIEISHFVQDNKLCLQDIHVIF